MSFTKISQNPLVHVIIAAFIGGALPVVEPILQGHAATTSTLKIALYAGVGAVLRAVVLFLKVTPPAAP
jgi:hypothetical protein